MKAAKVITKIATYFIISSQTFSFLPCFIHLSCATICLTAIQNTHPTKISIVPIGILSGLVAINRKFSRPEFSMVRPYRKSNSNYYIWTEGLSNLIRLLPRLHLPHHLLRRRLHLLHHHHLLLHPKRRQNPIQLCYRQL